MNSTEHSLCKFVIRDGESEPDIINCEKEYLFKLTSWIQEHRDSYITFDKLQEFMELTNSIEREIVSNADDETEIDDALSVTKHIFRPIKRAIMSVWDCGGRLKPWIAMNICKVLLGKTRFIDNLPRLSKGTYNRMVDARNANKLDDRMKESESKILSP